MESNLLGPLLGMPHSALPHVPLNSNIQSQPFKDKIHGQNGVYTCLY